jgi:hypothetical protein
VEVAWLEFDLDRLCAQPSARLVDVVDGERDVIVIRRPALERLSAYVDQERERVLWMVGEDRDPGELRTAHVAISNSRSTSLSEVLRSVDALRSPTISAQGRS